MIEHREQFVRFAKGQDIDEQKFASATRHLIDVVIRRDFQEYHDEEKLRSIARVKIIEVLNGDDMDLDRDPIPFLHRCVAQTIFNHIRDETKKQEPVHTVEDWSDVDEAYNEADNIEESIEIDSDIDVSDDDFEDHLQGLKLFKEYFNK
jgi:hypothetical protein